MGWTSQTISFFLSIFLSFFFLLSFFLLSGQVIVLVSLGFGHGMSPMGGPELGSGGLGGGLGGLGDSKKMFFQKIVNTSVKKLITLLRKKISKSRTLHPYKPGQLPSFQDVLGTIRCGIS